jgi:hypothetical protein
MAQFRNISRRRGAKRACVALGHTILCISYHLLKNPDATFRDLGADYFDKQHKSNLASHLMQRLAKLGFKVTISPAA